MRFVTLAICVLAAVVVPAAHSAGAQTATPSAKGYVTAGIGAGYSPTGNLAGSDTVIGNDGAHVEFDLGRPIGVLAGGIATASGWRFELDASLRYNDTEVLYFQDGREDLQPNSESQLAARSLLVNVVREWEVDGWLHPYLGAGLGNAWIDYEIQEYITDVQVLDDSGSALAYQIVAGFGVSLTPRLDLLLDYRYWQARDIALEDVAGTPIETDYTVQSGMLSLRYHPWGAASDRSWTTHPRHRGWYVQVMGGASASKDAEIKDNLANFDGFDPGPTAILATGVGWRERWQFELELSQRRNGVAIIDFNPEFGEDRTDGDVRARSLMANVRFRPTLSAPVEPYVLFGLGIASAQWDVSLHGDGTPFVDDESDAIAGQLAFGVAGRLSERIGVAAEYRYWMTGLFDMVQPDGRPLKTDLKVSSVLLGIRYQFL